MDSIEYSSVIKFLILCGVEWQEIAHQLAEVYQDSCPSQATIYCWIAQFKLGRTNIFDEEQPG